MSAPSLPTSSSQEAIARRHRRMQLGLGIEEDRRAERIAARTSFEEIEAGNHWVLVLGAACTAVGLIALEQFWIERSVWLVHAGGQHESIFF